MDGLPFRPKRPPEVDVDLVVIGGGVNGTGVARDASLRGFKVALFERNDLAFGASGNSSGMIHGGLRYLLDDPKVTKSSCTDSGYIQKIAPHLLFRIPFLMPIHQGPKAKIMMELMDGFFEAYDLFQPLKHGKSHTRLQPDEVYQIEPGLVPNLAGAMTFDEWGIDGSRLCAINAVDASENGAKIFVGVTVDRIERNPQTGGILGVHYLDQHTQQRGFLSTQVVINATGAWAPITVALGGVSPSKARVRPGKGIHVVFDRRLSNVAIAGQAIDGRQIFIEPWQNMSILATTDDDYYGDLDRVIATQEEVRYLVQGISKVFPAVRKARIIGTYAGVRPTLYEYGPSEDALSREHEIVDHKVHGAPGLFSMMGGKLASYRIFAEEMMDVLSSIFQSPQPCTTQCKPLPGGDRILSDHSITSQFNIDGISARRLIYRHGSRALPIAERTLKKKNETKVICNCEPVLEAEIRHVIQNEWARTVSDVARRTRLGLGACGGMKCAVRCGQIIADELGLSPEVGHRQALSFLEQQAKTRIVGIGSGQARQEVFSLSHLRSELNMEKTS